MYSIAKTYNYYYEGTNLIKQEWQEDNEIKHINFLYDSKGELFAFETTDSNRFFYARNSLKDIVGIIDKDGNILVKYKWDPYYNNVETTILGVALGVGLDIYDSVQRGVSPGGVVLGATLTAAKGVGLIYLNKGILYGATALGSAICPGVGTVVGFVVGGVVCVFVDIFVSNWLDELIDSIAK